MAGRWNEDWDDLWVIGFEAEYGAAPSFDPSIFYHPKGFLSLPLCIQLVFRPEP